MSGEQWVQCGCGQRHWGAYGAAGLLLVDDVPARRLVMQHRAEWTHFGGYWGVPGGARHRDEDAVTGALREAWEEAGIDPDLAHPVATRVLAHPDWSYTTVVARAEPAVRPHVTDAESQEITWVGLDRLASLPVLPALAQAWPELQQMVTTAATVIVDAANVVGARPDGWWRDRAGATERLLQRLERLAARGVPADFLGLAGHWWWPRFVLVTEGAARGVQGPADGAVQVVAAPRDGDAQIVAEAAERARTGSNWVVTADRELLSRVAGHGGRSLAPRRLLHLLDTA